MNVDNYMPAFIKIHDYIVKWKKKVWPLCKWLQKLRKQRSAGELDKRGTASVRSGGSGGSGSSWVSSVESSHSAMTHASLQTNSNASFVVEVRVLKVKRNLECPLVL